MIGIFDSGVGGLTVMKAICDELPAADIVYFGDIKHAPYGQKSAEEISQLTLKSIKCLQEAGATKIVSACNSVSVSLAMSLYDTFLLRPGHIIEMVGPTVSYFRHAEGKILLYATEATVKSGMYQNAFAMLGKDLTALPIPELAGAIEHGDEEEKIEQIITATRASCDFKPDIVILACTHYPLVGHIFQEIFDEDVLVFDPAHAVAERAKEQFWPEEVRHGERRILVSKKSDVCERLVATLFSEDNIVVEVVE